MKTALCLPSVPSNKSYLFRVPTAQRGDVFMCVSRSNFSNDQRTVVEVDSLKFLALWRSDPFSIHRDVCDGSPSTWRHDRKFHYAEEGFSYGQMNPVPLAEVGCAIHQIQTPIKIRQHLFLKKLIGYDRQEVPFISIINGITRTIWLLTFGAKFFPVECSNKEEAILLQNYAGLTGGHPKSVEELIPR